MYALPQLIRYRSVLRGLVVVATLASIAVGQESTSRPADRGKGSGVLQNHFDALDRLAIRGNVTAEEVDAVVSRAIKEATAIKNGLAGQQQVSTTQPKGGASSPGQDRQRVREQLCSLELLIGDLHCAGAELLQGDAAIGRANQAVQVYRRARIEYRETAISMMGYVGEAKALRAQKKLGDAAAALEPVIEATRKPSSQVQAELGRIATLEKMEILLAEDPARAVRELSAWRGSRAISSSPDWIARADWLLARASAEVLMRSPTSRPDSPAAQTELVQILAALRSPSVIRVASPRERLQVILKIEKKTGQSLMTAQEAAQWADLLWAAEAAQAIEFYQRAVKMDASCLSVGSGLRFASLLIKGQAYQEAAERCRRLAERKDASAVQRTTCLRWASACLVQLFRNSKDAEERTKFGRQAVEILVGLIGSDADAMLRRDCLREWAEIVGRLDGAGACLQTLQQQSELVQNDPWLLYALAAGLRDRARERASSGKAALDAANEIVAMLDKARRLAAETKAAELQGRIVLFMSSVKAEPPLLDKQAALVVLLEGWELLASQPDLVDEAVQARLDLLVELGLTEDALKFVEQLPAAAVGRSGDALLSLASILAERFGSVSDNNRDAEQQRVRALCQRAVSGTLQKGPDYDQVCLSAARILLRVKAGRDARALLESLSARSTGADPSTARAIRLLIAEAYGQEGKLNEAIAICDKLQGDSPQHHPVLMTRARLATAVNNPADAVSWYRKAREAARAGSQEWCEATLGMADALLQDDKRADAGGLLRVCLALYPDFANPQLLSSAKKLQARAARSDDAGLLTPTTNEE